MLPKTIDRVRSFIASFLRSVWLYGPGILAVIATHFIFNDLPQGQDIIIQIGEQVLPFGLTMICIVIWSYLMWYSSRIIGYREKNDTDGIPEYFHQHIPKLMAYNGLVSIQAAILALPTILDLSAWMVWVIVIIHNILYFFLNRIFSQGYKHPAAKVGALIIVTAYVVLLLFLSWQHRHFPFHLRHQFLLPLIALVLFGFQIGLLAFIIKRREDMEQKNIQREQGPVEMDTDFIKLFNQTVIRVPASLLRREQIYFNVFNVVAALCTAIYLSAILSIRVSDLMGPLSFTLLAFGIMVGFANIITYFSIRFNLNLFVIILFLMVIVGWLADPYEVRLIPASVQNVYDRRPDLKTYFEKWIALREDEIKTSPGSFPVYLVLADGGASRSGYWVASVLSAWEDVAQQSDSVDALSEHLFCLSGTSGGSVGNATFYALLKTKSEQDSITCLWRTQHFLGTDFLTYCLAHYFGPDLIRHVIPISFIDRAAALEEVMGEASKKYVPYNFDEPLSHVMDTTGRLPVFFFNTTEVQEGTPAVVSSIKINDFSKRLDVLAEVDSTSQSGWGDLRLSTAVIMSARFPYICPAGKIRSYYFVDGGYFDNSGSGIVHEMMQRLQTLVHEDSAHAELYSKLRFHLVHISNTSLDSVTKKSIHPLVNDLASPLLTVLNTYTSQTLVNDQRLIQFFKRSDNAVIDEEMNLYVEDDSISYPMNWVISDYNLQRMNIRLEQVLKKIPSGNDENETHQ